MYIVLYITGQQLPVNEYTTLIFIFFKGNNEVGTIHEVYIYKTNYNMFTLNNTFLVLY